MNKSVELPLIEPIYGTYHFQGSGAAILASNPSIRNWYLNQIMILFCEQRFLEGHTSPELNILYSFWSDNPYLEKYSYSTRFFKGHTGPIIRSMLDDGFYVYFEKVDDYFVEGKGWYHQRHFGHDGLICGYDQTKKTYSLYAYDSNWIYQRFTTRQKAFHAGQKAMQEQGVYGMIHAIRPGTQEVAFDPAAVYQKLLEYLDSSLEKYPLGKTPAVHGIAVQEYLVMYLDRLLDGSVSYPRTDRRIFRLIWEHKTVMLERIQKAEAALHLGHTISNQYIHLVTRANAMRMLYASHLIKRRDSLLRVIRRDLMWLKNEEQKLLTQFTHQLGGALQQ